MESDHRENESGTASSRRRSIDGSRQDPGSPQDARVDRRAFLHRMGALTATAAFGTGWPPASLPAPGTSAEQPGATVAVGGETNAFWESAAQEVADRGIDSAAPETLTAWEAGVLIREGSLQIPELVEASLRRIERFDRILKAFNTVTSEEARSRAASLSSGCGSRDSSALGLLYGIPLGLKDNIYTEGVRTTANAHMFRDFVPDWDATLVTRLRAAGAVMVGKTQMGPLAVTRALTPDGEITTVSAWAPNDPTVSPGGSSSGSATAVAARLVTSSLGTQTGGSITGPASAQGLTGLKPTMGRVSLRGVIPLSYTRDHPGPLARDARDTALLLQVMAGPDPGDPRTLGLPPVPDYLSAATPVLATSGARVRWPTRLGIPQGWKRAPGAQGERRRTFLQVMESGGVEIREVELPPQWADLSSRFFNSGRLPERSEPFLPWLRKDVRLFGVTLASWIQGLLLSGDEYVKVQRARLALLRLALDRVFVDCDAIVQDSHLAFDMIGLPLITFPIGFRSPDEREGRSQGSGVRGPPARLPEGVLIGAPPFGEERLLALASLWQARSQVHRSRPPDPTEEVSRGNLHRGRLDVEEVAEQAE